MLCDRWMEASQCERAELRGVCARPTGRRTQDGKNGTGYRRWVNIAFNVGCGVLRMRTAHCKRVVGAPSAGTTSSMTFVKGRGFGDDISAGGRGGGSANSTPIM